MRVVEVHAHYAPYIGGVERMIQGLSVSLAERGHEVTVVCSDEGPLFETLDGVKVVRLRSLAKIGNTPVPIGLRRSIVSLAPDVVHTHVATAVFPDIGTRVARRLGIRSVLTFHNELSMTGVRGVLAGLHNSLLMPGTLDSADRIVITSPRMAEDYKILSDYRNRLTLIPWGVDQKLFSPIRRPRARSGLDFRLGFVGVLDSAHDYKGLDVLLRSMQATRAATRDIRLYIVGSGDASDRWKAYATRLGIESKVEWLGRVTDSELREFYSSLDAFVLPSTDGAQEGFGLVALEALACGTPAIVSQVVGPARQIAESGAGIVVNSGDVDNLASAIRALAEDPARLSAMSRAAPDLIDREFRWESVVDRYERLLGSDVLRQGLHADARIT